MKKFKFGKSLISIGVTFTLSAVLGIVFFNQASKNLYMDKLNNMKTSTLASFMDYAKSVDELTDLADIIIEGKTIDYKAEIRDGLVFTKETVEAKKVIKGDVEKGDKVIVVFTGGELNEMTTPPIKDCPIMDMRGNYMLFLKTNDGINYFIVGGNLGFGLIKDNKILTPDQSSLGDIIRSYDVNKLEDQINNKIMK